MSTFALDIGASQADLISALNYAIANLGTGTGGSGNVVANIGANVLYVDTVSGQISSNSSGTIGYLYGFVNVKYANSATGSSGFTSNCSMTQYYGVHNTTNGTISSNPVDYSWYQVTGGFGTTKGLYYTNVGGYQAKFNAGTVPPNQFYAPVKDNTAIALITLANSVVTSNSIQPGAVTNVSIASNTIQGQNIQTGTLTGNLIAANTITGNTIQAGTITGNLIQANTITGNLIQANTITGNLIQANTITGNLIQANTITGNLIQANTIVGTSIIANTVYGNAIIANTLNGNTIQANTIQANTIQGNSIVAGSITATQLQANLLTVGNIVSIGSTLNDPNATGYWLNNITGNVRMGGNVSIGNNLTVSGLITQGTLSNNTVATQTIIDNAVSSFVISAFSSPIAWTTWSNSYTYYNSPLVVTITTTLANQSIYVYAGLNIDVSINGGSGGGTYGGIFGCQITRTPISGSPTSILQTISNITPAYTAGSGVTVDLNYTNIFIGFADTIAVPGTYVYRVTAQQNFYGSSNWIVNSRNFNFGTLTLQTLKK